MKPYGLPTKLGIFLQAARLGEWGCNVPREVGGGVGSCFEMDVLWMEFFHVKSYKVIDPFECWWSWKCW